MVWVTQKGGNIKLDTGHKIKQELGLVLARPQV